MWDSRFEPRSAAASASTTSPNGPLKVSAPIVNMAFKSLANEPLESEMMLAALAMVASMIMIHRSSYRRYKVDRSTPARSATCANVHAPRPPSSRSWSTASLTRRVTSAVRPPGLRVGSPTLKVDSTFNSY